MISDTERATQPTTEQTSGADVAVLGHFLEGEELVPAGTRLGDVFDPATGMRSTRVAYADAATVDRAVAAARRAFPGWRDTPPAKRAALFFRYRELIREHAAELAAAISREHGKVPSDAAGEVQRGLEIVEFACGIPSLLQGEFAHDVATGLDTYTLREPLGVVAGITPFNFPAMVPMWMFPIAIACGNTFVLKPSEKDPTAANLLARLARDAGFPSGVLQVVHGDVATVNALLEHPDVAAVSFVGSTPVAQSIYEKAARSGKRVQALGGAKNHMVVLPDADLDLAADAAVSAAYGSAGERCMAVSVVVAVGAAADPLVTSIAERVDALRVGAATDPDAQMGPLISCAHRDRVASYVERGVGEGATLVRGPEQAPSGAGFFLGPALFDHVTPEMSIYRDEIFGPVLCVVRAGGLEEAIELINRNPWANGTALFTQNGAAARRFEDRIEVGMVGINVPIPVPVGWFSFGGWRASLFGTSGIYGPEGVRFYTRQKVVTRRWPRQENAGVDLSFPAERR